MQNSNVELDEVIGPVEDLNDLLAVCIPTYNRPDFIKDQVEKIGPLLKKYNISIYVSDNSENLETFDACIELKKKYNLEYHKNNQNIGDKNFLKAISYPVSVYRWIISDSIIFDQGNLQKIIKICKTYKYDYILLNSGRVNIHQDMEYTDYNKLLGNLGWHLTLLPSFVYSYKVIQEVEKIKRYENGNFTQHALLFEIAPFKNYKIFWVGSFRMTVVAIKKKNTWTKILFPLWAKRWTEYVLSLPDIYPLEIKLKCIKDHAKYSGLFNLRKLLLYRSEYILNLRVLITYWKYLHYILSTPNIFFMIIISLVPSRLLTLSLKIVRKKH